MQGLGYCLQVETILCEPAGADSLGLQVVKECEYFFLSALLIFLDCPISLFALRRRLL